MGVAILYNDPLYGKLHLATKLQAVMWFPRLHLPGPSLSWKISRFRGTRTNWPSMAISSNDLLHGTVHHPTKFQADSWNRKELEWQRRPSDLLLAYSGNFRVPWNAQNWPSLAILNSDLLHVTVLHPTKFQSNSLNPWRVRAVASSLRLGPSQSWKILKFHGLRINWPSMAILDNYLLHVTVHHPTRFQTDTWNL